ncbi:folliculin-like isoform X2 [Babylonia areolata]|uniref:folliculin-like isoform X2 n=1 Tax=Babylonia areolata TaxID=304850 RepID=UPI003FD2A615
MNAIISLCHFCEVHGPKILFCTQTLRPQEAEEEENGASGAVPRERVSSLSERLKSVSLTQQTSDGGSSGDPAALPPTAHTAPPKDTHGDHTKSVCEGCQSVKTGYVSHDEEAFVSYISTQHPHMPQIFTRMRQACIRSLSCEVCQGREGPIFFGDDQNGNVLSHTFYVADNQARGRQRLYSIVVFMMDRIYLLNSWPFLLPQLQTIIDTLKNKAQKVMKEEADKMPQAVNRTSQLEPYNFLKKKGIHNKPARSLAELTGDKNIFKMLHVAFVWTLKACGSRLTETLLEGPPTEDSIIDMENQEETEEGFIKINTKKISEEATPSCLPSEDGAVSVWRGEEEAGSGVCTQEGGHTEGSQSAPHSARPVITSLRQLMKMLLPRGCCRIIYHSDCYEESWRCNFLGQNPDTVLPDHLVSAERFLLVEVVQQVDQTFSSLDSDLSEADEDFRAWDFRLINPVPVPEKVPTVLGRMHMALKNENLTEKVVEQCFVCLKEEWMNKVKVLFKFTKAGGGRSEDETQKLLQVVGAREEDKPLLKFWMTGLSVQYRTHILASSKHR